MIFNLFLLAFLGCGAVDIEDVEVEEAELILAAIRI